MSGERNWLAAMVTAPFELALWSMDLIRSSFGQPPVAPPKDEDRCAEKPLPFTPIPVREVEERTLELNMQAGVLVQKWIIRCYRGDVLLATREEWRPVPCRG